MSAHDTTPRTRLGGVEFPVQTHRVHGIGRHHVHEFPHQPGGAPEKLGRSLYHVTLAALFHDRFPAYPDLYPNGLNKLRTVFEYQQTTEFVHPTIGTFPAFIVGWSQTKEARVRSGEHVDIEIIEDQQALFSDISSSFAIASQGNVASSAAQLAAQLTAVRAASGLDPSGNGKILIKPGTQSLFDSLQSAANSITAVKDTSAMIGNLLSAKLQQLMNIATQLDAAAELQDPRAWPLVDAIRNMWATTNRLYQDLQSKKVQLQKFTVRATSSLADVANAIYGDTSRQSDLLSLNSDVITNPLRIQAGTTVRYYPVS